MSARTLIFLGAAAIALALLAVLGQRSNEPAARLEPQPLVPGLEPALDELQRVSLVKAGNEAVATLERQPQGWVVAERGGYPADIAKLRQALTALAEARIIERKTANPDFYERLGIADVELEAAGGVAVSLEAAGAEQFPTVIVGDAEGTEYRYVRRAGETQSYLIDRNPDLARSTPQWLDPVILDVRGARIQEVVISHPDGETVRISKQQRSETNFTVADVPEGRELQYPGVANVIGNALRELNLEDVEPATAAIAEEQTTVEFRAFDGLVVDGTGFERDGESWVAFEASFDPELAARFATETENENENEPADAAAAEVDGDSGSAASQPSTEASSEEVRAEAERINRRVMGWRYRIASFQHDQMTRRMSDLLNPAADASEDPAQEE
jgi:hypothetical protein